MQAVVQAALGKRARYYHSQIDMDLLVSGKEYLELSDSYVIFICDFDPFGQEKYRYTFRKQCLEDTEVQLEDGVETIFLSTRGRNPEEVPKELVKFLRYVSADLQESMEDFEDEFVNRLQRAVQDIKQSRTMEEKYMLTELLMQDERRAGRAEELKESILTFLEEIGSVPDTCKEKIRQENELGTLRKWLKLAVKADSIERFLEQM